MKPFEELTEAEKAIRLEKQAKQHERLEKFDTHFEKYTDEKTGKVKTRSKPITTPLGDETGDKFQCSSFYTDHTFTRQTSNYSLLFSLILFALFLAILVNCIIIFFKK